MSTAIAQSIIAKGFTIEDARTLRPTDIVEGVLALVRRGERRVLVLERMTAKEAAMRLLDAYNDGWQAARWIRIGPERHPLASLGLRRPGVA